MSFSSEVKQELAKQSGKSRHCQIAELAALVAFDGKRQQLIGDAGDVLDSENPLLQEKYGLLLAQLFHVNIEEIDTLPPERILETIKMWNQSLRCADITETVNGILLQQTCCRRAYIRGAFLAGGSISDPNKSYHFEIVCREIAQAKQLQDAINSFEMEAKIVERKKHQVVYLKEGAQIVDMLNIMEAHVALMNLENVRILKEMRNSVNRKVNCETANISKTVAVCWIRPPQLATTFAATLPRNSATRTAIRLTLRSLPSFSARSVRSIRIHRLRNWEHISILRSENRE